MRYFSRGFLGHNTEPRKLNRRDDEPGSIRKDDISDSLREEIMVYHAEDMALYKQALAARESRPGGAN